MTEDKLTLKAKEKVLDHVLAQLGGKRSDVEIDVRTDVDMTLNDGSRRWTMTCTATPGHRYYVAHERREFRVWE